MLDVATTATDEVNSLASELGHGRLTAHLELSLLDVDDHLSSGQAALMTRITANTYTTVRSLLRKAPCVEHLPMVYNRSVQAIHRLYSRF